MALSSPLLDQLDTQLDALTQALLAGAPERVEQLGAQVHQTLLLLGKPRGNSVPASIQQRLASSQTRFGQIRMSLARRSAAVERELSTLLPQAVPATYRPPVRGAGFGSIRY
jgi:hypothetical protein